ncbi:tetrahydrofolate dehydrogenase/cyclohydrolase catalytic domain-containing protein [Pontibacter sp. G13]|uniref:tetrahydrofolate dehydrogenase/cyclohydrolase catalytic domain-containing protein n=1 Tax=Pontibacter sp. G13 TaxID=3074898 RepID=UPI002889B54E|nr:tetrahydrofolate dehydrogenase/cyclohydrolase catalytic domain-containing protein [Pontibacter sp. G13]WNJ21493.1 tetrahydrofolate dehydrogenase/cyclohydrolase catalytic domain-containing protein [Pontibacter sp. G13]
MPEPLLLDGKSLSKQLEQTLSSRVENLSNLTGTRPTLATILVGDDPASATYVAMKAKACHRVGMESISKHLPSHTTTEELLSVIRDLNEDPNVHGILLQHPVPHQIDERAAFDAISPLKDVDGVTAAGFGSMTMGSQAYGSATPAGIMRLLSHYHIPLEGKHAVVIGRSPILGKPMAMMLLNAHATVTICHSRTQNLPELVRQSDIVVAAVGKPKFVQADWIKQGSILVDAGYHPGRVGDIDLEAAKSLSAAYTPVPGGVGPMTISTLMAQTFEAASMLCGQPC